MRLLGLIRFTEQRPYKKLSWVLGTIVFYVLVFQMSYPIVGAAIAPLAALPALTGGWLLGLRAGLIIGVLMNLLNWLLFASVAATPEAPILMAIPNAISVVVAGLLTGWLKQLLDRLDRQSQQVMREREILTVEIAKRRRVERSLRRVQDQLKARVEERTDQLAETNAALRQTEINLRAILDNGTQAFVLLDLNHRVQIANKVFQQISRDFVNREVQMGDSILPLMDAERLERFQRNFATALTGRPLIFEESITGPDQTDSWFEWTYTPIFDRKGRVNQVCLAGVDISDRRKAEERIWQATQRFQSLIENAADVVVIVDTGGIFRYLSPSTERILGYRSEDVIGSCVFELMHPEDVPFAQKALARTDRAPDGTTPIQVRVLHQDGSWRVVEGTAQNLLDNPAVAGIVVTIRDVTQRVGAERALQTYTAQLEQSNRELQDFAFVASHDLQEPLRKVRAFSDRLKTKYSATLDDQGRDYLTRMQDAAARMQTLIQDLLTFSRVTTRAQPFGPVNLTQVARGVVSDLETDIRQVAGRVNVGDLPNIEADPSQMRQLLHNLVSNSLKFHREDEPPLVQIRAEALNEPAGNGKAYSSQETVCQLTVEDNGIGFEEKYLDRIFQVFQRLHGRDEYSGTGIGLAVCRKIVERHIGTITATSAPGQGSRFIVTLPVEQAEENRNLFMGRQLTEQAKENTSHPAGMTGEDIR